MFPTRELDSKFVDEAILISINNLFSSFQKESLNNFSELIDQKILLNLCEEMDSTNYSTFRKNFLFDKNIGILYAEMKELITKLIDLLKKTGINFKTSFNKDFDSINVNSLINKNKNEIKKLVNLLILSVFNCPLKDYFIDKIANFEEFQQQELIKIVERYMLIEDNTRESINKGSINVSNRNTLNPESSSNLNLIESEFTWKYLSRIDLLEKERDNLEKEKVNRTIKEGELESDIEKLKKEKINLNEEVKKSEEVIKSLTTEKEDLNKTIFTLQLANKELEELSKDAKYVNELKVNIEDKDAYIAHLMIEIKELNEKHQNELKQYEEKIEILQEKNSNYSELKNKYEKMREIVKDYDALKEKIVLFEAVNKEFNKIKNNYVSLQEEKEGLESLVKELEEKLDENLNNYNKLKEASNVTNVNNFNDLRNEIKKKNDNKNNDLYINSRNDSEDFSYYANIIEEKDVYIKALEQKVKSLQEIKIGPTLYPNTNYIPISNSNNDKIKSLESEILLIKTNLENEILKKNEEIELYKKDNLETKERYEKEFELMASSVYNLGLNYWSMKMDYTQKLSEKPNWLIKERQKYYNGDF